MKRSFKNLIVIFALCMLTVLLASCDFQAQIESISNMIYDAATNVGGQFLKETTYVSESEETPDSESTDTESSEAEPSESTTSEQTDTSADTVTDTESSTGGDDTPTEPTPPPLPTRTPSTVDAMMGTNVDFVLPNRFPATNPILEHLYTNKYFSFVRVYKDYSEGMNEDYEQLALTRASTVYQSRTSLLLDLEFAKFVESIAPSEPEGGDTEGGGTEAETQTPETESETTPETEAETTPETEAETTPETETAADNAEGVGINPLSDEISDVQTYLELAQAIYQYEKAYENQMFGKLRLIEIGRHPEKSISAAEYAKIFSLAYDGGNTDAENVGVINANAEAKLVMGALSQPDSTYVRELMEALEALRPDAQPLFVGAFNTEAFASGGVTPESVYLAEDSELVKMAQYRNESYNHVELFVSAFGYNTIDEASEYYVTEQVQANYLVRSFLIFSSLGVDNASICQLKDAESSEYNGFGTITVDNTAKIASYYLSTMKNTLTGYTFNAKIENAQDAMVYEFIDTEGNKIYAVWNATDGDDVIENVLVSVPDIEGIMLTELVAEYGEGNKTELMPSEGFVSVNATATPKFVYVPAQIAE